MEQAPVNNQKDVSEWALAAALRDNRRHSNEDHPGAVPPVHNSGETPELNSNSFEEFTMRSTLARCGQATTYLDSHRI